MKWNAMGRAELKPSKMLQKFVGDCREMPRLASQGSGPAKY